MNLRTKFRLGSALLILLVVGGVMGSLYVSEKKRLWMEIEQEQSKDLENFQSVYENALGDAADELPLVKFTKKFISPKTAYAGYNKFKQDKDDRQDSGWIYYYDPIKDERLLSFISSSDPLVQPLLNYKKRITRDVVFQGRKIREMSMPSNNGLIRLGYAYDTILSDFNKTLALTIKRLLIVGLVALLIGLVFAQIFSQALSTSISQLMFAADAIAKGEKGIRIPVQGKDELGRLVKTFNHMSEELGKLDALKDEFMSHVTHELRSPLTSIIATVELMAEMPVMNKDPKLRRSIDRLIFGSERLNRLVDNILDLTRMEAGKMPFDIQPINIGKIVAEMADFFEPRAMEKGLKIRAIVTPELPLAMADPEKIRQVISNLVLNAIKFTNKGGIVLWAKEQNGLVHVGIQDTGVGIPKDKLSSVFSKFETLKHTRDKVEKPVPGSGLGLNIVQNSIKAQGGKIWVESEIDKGSTFIFTLPMASKELQERTPVESSESDSAMRMPPAPATTRMVVVKPEKSESPSPQEKVG